MATQYPSVYWNCACLITNSGGGEDEEIIDIDTDDEDDEEEETKKKKNKTTNYGKIATAIGTMQQRGILISPPDINKSSFSFIPDAELNTIVYGIKGINKIGNELVATIIQNRPYKSIEDFTNKVKLNKPQMINLIKSGAFDKFGSSREEIMENYVGSISDQKKKLTLQNMQMLINFEMLPEFLSQEIKIYNFTKYIRKFKDGDFYLLDNIAYNFYKNNYDEDELDFINNEDIVARILIKTWDKIYKSEMETVKNYIKANHDILLKNLNKKLMSDTWDKYCIGSISKWEMDSISFYYHEHELINVPENVYEIVNFFKLPEDPVVDKVIPIKGREIPLYKLHKIVGTVLDKNKTKNSVSLLTKYGVVQIKIYQAQFAKYDKQISMKMPDGKKKVVEKSWFSRGNKLMFMGIRRGDTFVPKAYKNSVNRDVIQLITGISEDGFLTLRKERIEVD